MRLLAPATILPPNTPMAYGLAGVSGRDVLELEMLRRFLDGVRAGPLEGLSAAVGFDLRHPMFPLLGVSRILVPRGMPVAEEEGRVVAASAALSSTRTVFGLIGRSFRDDADAVAGGCRRPNYSARRAASASLNWTGCRAPSRPGFTR